MFWKLSWYTSQIQVTWYEGNPKTIRDWGLYIKRCQHWRRAKIKHGLTFVYESISGAESVMVCLNGVRMKLDNHGSLRGIKQTLLSSDTHYATGNHVVACTTNLVVSSLLFTNFRSVKIQVESNIVRAPATTQIVIKIAKCSAKRQKATLSDLIQSQV